MNVMEVMDQISLELQRGGVGESMNVYIGAYPACISKQSRFWIKYIKMNKMLPPQLKNSITTSVDTYMRAKAMFIDAYNGNPKNTIKITSDQMNATTLDV